MTTKESLYLDDALGHAQFLAKQCREAAGTLADPSLRKCAEKLAGEYGQMYQRFYDQL